MLGALLSLWPRGEGLWWQKLINGYETFAVVTLFFVAFLVIGNRMARRKSSKD
jgi:hypothetical protein